MYKINNLGIFMHYGCQWQLAKVREHWKRGVTTPFLNFSTLWFLTPIPIKLTYHNSHISTMKNGAATTSSLPCVPLASRHPKPLLGEGWGVGDPGYKARVSCTNIGSGTCFACRMSDTTGWVVGRAVQVRDVTNENFTGVAGEVKKDIHCFSPISCLT